MNNRIRRIDACTTCNCGLLAPAHHNEYMDDHHPFVAHELLTPDTITDEQILKLKEALLRESGMQMTNDTDACGMALTNPSEPRFADVKDVAEWARAYGRARCAEILNNRAEQITITETIVDELISEGK